MFFTSQNGILEIVATTASMIYWRNRVCIHLPHDFASRMCWHWIETLFFLMSCQHRLHSSYEILSWPHLGIERALHTTYLKGYSLNMCWKYALNPRFQKRGNLCPVQAGHCTVIQSYLHSFDFSAAPFSLSQYLW